MASESAAAVLASAAYTGCICGTSPCSRCTLITDQSTGTEVVYAASDAAYAALDVVFRGTDQWREWVFNCRNALVPCPWMDGKIHQGFLQKYASVRTDLLTLARGHGGALRVAGHSVGGAIACLFASELIATGGRVDMVTTLGAPKPGDAAFAESLRGRCRRVASPLDPVTRFPLRCGYRPCGDLRAVFFAGHSADQYTRAVSSSRKGTRRTTRAR